MRHATAAIEPIEACHQHVTDLVKAELDACGHLPDFDGGLFPGTVPQQGKDTKWPAWVQQVFAVAVLACQAMNHPWKPTSNVRASGRFFMPTLLNHGEWADSPTVLAAEDRVALIYDDGESGKWELGYAMLERVDTVQKGKSKITQTVVAVAHDNPNALLRYTWFDKVVDTKGEPMRDSEGRLQFTMPLSSSFGYQSAGIESYLCVVDMRPPMSKAEAARRDLERGNGTKGQGGHSVGKNWHLPVEEERRTKRLFDESKRAKKVVAAKGTDANVNKRAKQA
jgi:hypothetical protein